MNPEVARYIEENRDRYTREAIDKHLLSAGYGEAEIDASWPPDDQQKPPLLVGRAFWRPFIGAIVGVYGVVFLVYAVSFFVATDEMLGPIISGIMLSFLFLAAGLSVDIVKWKRKSWSGATSNVRRAGVASGLLSALVIPFVFLVIIAGVCSAITGLPFTGSRF